MRSAFPLLAPQEPNPSRPTAVTQSLPLPSLPWGEVMVVASFLLVLRLI